jgi:hypothetical protein
VKSGLISHYDIMTKETYWYSEIYNIKNYGFYINKKDNKYYLGFKYKNGKCTEVKITYDTFVILKKEWK